MRRIALMAGIVILLTTTVLAPVGADAPPTHRIVDANGDVFDIAAPYKVKEVHPPPATPPRKSITHAVIDANRFRVEVAAPYVITPVGDTPPTTQPPTTTTQPPTTTTQPPTTTTQPPTTTTPPPTTTTPPPTTTTPPPTTTTPPPTTTTPPPTTTTQPPTGGEARFSGDVSLPGGFTVPAGETWAFDPNKDTTVTVQKNIIVLGVLRMRPNAGVNHVVKFANVNESAMVGGGMMPLATDVGMWVMESGRLDAAGEPRTGWNRTGTDPTWTATDEIVVAPTAVGAACTFPDFVGGTVPRLDASVPAAEVVNLTRTVRIEGTPNGRSHVFIHSDVPQTITDVAIRWMGPNVLGRYPLHFHHMMNASRGSLVESVVVRDSGDHAFVIHGSHGVTLRDTVAFDIVDDAYWWDSTRGGHTDNATNDIVYDHAFAGKVRPDSDHPYNLSGFLLSAGTGGVVRDSAAVCIEGPENTGGYNWPSVDVQAWDFDDNVAHHSRNGIVVWQNDSTFHKVSGFVAYANRVGIDHGAYANGYSYDNAFLYRNETGIELHAAARANATWACVVERKSTSGVALRVLRSNSATIIPVTFAGSDFEGSVVNGTNGQTLESRVTFTSKAC